MQTIKIVHSNVKIYELSHRTFCKIASVSSEDSDQPAHSRRSIRIIAVCLKTTLGSLSTYRVPCEDSDPIAQADLSLRWARMQSCSEFAAACGAGHSNSMVQQRNIKFNENA